MRGRLSLDLNNMKRQTNILCTSTNIEYLGVLLTAGDKMTILTIHLIPPFLRTQLAGYDVIALINFWKLAHWRLDWYFVGLADR